MACCRLAPKGGSLKTSAFGHCPRQCSYIFFNILFDCAVDYTRMFAGCQDLIIIYFRMAETAVSGKRGIMKTWL